jgi:hypothetical protein
MWLALSLSFPLLIMNGLIIIISDVCVYAFNVRWSCEFFKEDCWMIPVKETSFSLSIDMDHLMIGYGTARLIKFFIILVWLLKEL